jgi:hypothetical protein
MGGRFIPTHPRNKPVAEFVDNNFALDRKIKEALGDVPKSTQWLLMELPRDEDKELIADFIINWSNESSDGMPMSPNTKTAYVSADFKSHMPSFINNICICLLGLAREEPAVSN